MKKILFILFLLPCLVYGQSTTIPELFEVVHIKVKLGQEKAFEAAVKKHNAEFHKKDTPHNAQLFYNITGSWGGYYSWIMGPTSFTAMDNRPINGAHDNNWSGINQYIEDVQAPTYWSYDEKISHAGNVSGSTKSLVWILDIKKGKGSKVRQLIKQIKKVYAEKMPDDTYSVYRNELRNTSAGEDIAIIFPFHKWAWLDKEDKIREHYNAVYGAGSFTLFISEWQDCILGEMDVLREKIK